MNDQINVTALVVLLGLLLAVVGYGWLKVTETARNPGLEGGSSEVLKAATTTKRAAFVSGDIHFVDQTIAAGADGCNLAFTALERGPYFTNNLLQSTLSDLLKIERDQFSAERYNALHSSDLTFIASRVVDDTVAVELRGWLRVENACQQAQAVEQLHRTISRVAGTERVEVFLNQRPLEQVLRFESRF